MNNVSKLHFTYPAGSLVIYLIVILVYWLAFLHRDCSMLWDFKTLHLFTSALIFTSLVGLVDDKMLNVWLGLGITQLLRLWKYEATENITADEVKNRAKDKIWTGYKCLELPLTFILLVTSTVEVVI